MATMVKGKRREKKKSKEKSDKEALKTVSPSVSVEAPREDLIPCFAEKSEISESVQHSLLEGEQRNDQYKVEIETENYSLESPDTSEYVSDYSTKQKIDFLETISASDITEELPQIIEMSDSSCTYDELCLKLERVQVPTSYISLTEDREQALEAEDAYLSSELLVEESGVEAEKLIEDTLQNKVLENVEPSAPMLEADTLHVSYRSEVFVVNEVPKLKSMSLDEAVRLFGGTEITEVMMMSEREEVIVESGPRCGPEHPLVDLLSTFRRSLIAVERERSQLALGLDEEEKFRSKLWKIEKRFINETQQCPCGLSVYFKGKYDHAEFQTDKLPIARMRLESLLRDVQDSYCHHQHEALLAHYQIEEFISEIVQTNKSEIREALTLVLQALKLSDTAPAALATALQRWAKALTAALLDGGDLRQLLFLIHHLFRQTRSVRWAARVIRLTAGDTVSAARVIALLELLFARPRLEAGVECVEDKDEEWEEVYKDGVGGAVSDGTLRERDLLALLHAFPLRDLVARIVLFTNSDVRLAHDYQWGDTSGGRNVLRACCGVRALLRALTASMSAHPNYTRLRKELTDVAVQALHALAALHDRCSDSYSKELEPRIQGELQACFVTGANIVPHDMRPRLPATLLSPAVARDYCRANMADLLHHADEMLPVRVECLSMELPPLPCGVRVRIVTQAAADRRDLDVARMVLEFLFHVGVCRNISACAGECRDEARLCLPRLLAAHRSLYPVALHLFAETNQVEKLDPSTVSYLCLGQWRPQSGEVCAVLGDWSSRCPQLLPPLLLQLDYTPATGVSLESQLAIGSWLCERVFTNNADEEWCWRVQRRLRVHRAAWSLPRRAPPPSPPSPPSPPALHLFSCAYALMASEWGHSVPLICSEGVEALVKLAKARVEDAVRCLGPLMLMLASSPDSIVLTDKFTELVGLIVAAGPGLLSRALRRGGASGSDLLLALAREQLATEHEGIDRRALIRAWIALLWRHSVPAAGTLLDNALMVEPDYRHLDRFAIGLAFDQSEESRQKLQTAMKWHTQAPLVCCRALVAWHSGFEVRTALYPRLLDVLHSQRGHQSPHVDNALKLLGVNINAEELVIYRTATAAIAVPFQHPAHILIWQLFFQMYLERPPMDMRNTTPPVGPLFFSGIFKSRTLAQIKRRLQETIKYHRDEINNLETVTKSRAQKPTAVRVSRSESQSVDNSLTTPLSIKDLTGESSDFSDFDSEVSGEGDETSLEVESWNDVAMETSVLVAYHLAAEKLLSEYAQWLDEGDNVRAGTFHADHARLIPEPALAAAWRLEAQRRAPVIDLESPTTSPSPCLPQPERLPFKDALNALNSIKDHSRRRWRQRNIQSPVDDVDFRDSRSLLSLVDKHLMDVERLAQEWCTEVAVASSLDSSLLELVRAWRVARPLPTMQAVCANKCAPRKFTPQAQEWCISIGAEQGITENRTRARVAFRQLARPRPHAARTAAALLTIARRTNNGEAARRICSRISACARDVPAQCSPAVAALMQPLESLAERWLAQDGAVCAELITSWCGAGSSALQHQLSGALVAPQRAPPAHLPRLHAALLPAHLPPHVLFSYLSKFELGRWASTVDSSSRMKVLENLILAAQRWGPTPGDDYLMLTELIGVQMAAVCTSEEIWFLVHNTTRGCVCTSMPPALLAHVVRAADTARDLTFDQMGHLLRKLGVIWWEARTGLKGSKLSRYTIYAENTALLLKTLHRVFVDTAVQQSYAPERVAVYAWSTLQESWGPWITPHAATAPLLSSQDEHDYYTKFLEEFIEAIKQVMADCPGTEQILLNRAWHWLLQTYQSTIGAGLECQVQMSALAAVMAGLPWTQHQWITGTAIQTLLDMSESNDKEMLNWCTLTCRGQTASSWLRGVDPDHLVVSLDALLYLFTCCVLQFDQQTLEEAVKLPWSRLPEAALDDSLVRFYRFHHGLPAPFHSLPQFRVLVSASELCPNPEGQISNSTNSRNKRGCGVSQLVRAAGAPQLVAHVTAHTTCLLETLTLLAPHLPPEDGELEELLGRAAVIMCIEPAAAQALPVWEKWIPTCSSRLCMAGLHAACSLTAVEYCAPLASQFVRACLALPDSAGWSCITSTWRSCPWQSAAVFCARGRLHAAYATLLTYPHNYTDVLQATRALMTAPLNFVEDEAIIAVWICATCRIARSCGEPGEQADCRDGALTLLRRWATAARRSLLRIVGLQQDTAHATAQQRLLSSFAICILTPGDENAIRSYEGAYAAVQGLSPEVATWARDPQPKRLPRLAVRLYPHADKYFKEELDMAPEE